MTTLFSSDQLQFTLLELNPVSFQKIQRVVQQMEIGAYVRRIVQTDATTYQIPVDEQIDILLSETMQNALKREQQVPIICNLLQQIDYEVILIPELIELQLAVMNPTLNQNRMLHGSKESCSQVLGSFFKLDVPSVRTFYTNHQHLSNTHKFPDCHFKITEDIQKKFSELYVFTRLCVYQEIEIFLSENGLTIPYKLTDFDDQEKKITNISIAYELGEEPDIHYSFS